MRNECVSGFESSSIVARALSLHHDYVHLPRVERLTQVLADHAQGAASLLDFAPLADDVPLAPSQDLVELNTDHGIVAIDTAVPIIAARQ